MEVIVVVAMFALFLIGITLMNMSANRKHREFVESQNKVTVAPTTQVTVNLKPLQDAINGLPNKVLHSITSSTNTQKGSLGELIGYLKLHAQYDRMIPLGNIVDFVCIKFPDESGPGHIDFIDIKTGKQSRLSKDQRELQKLIKDKHINFVKLKVETTTGENTAQ